MFTSKSWSALRLFALLVLSVAAPVQRVEATGWDPSFGTTAALNGIVYDIAVMGSDLYIAGDFTMAGGVTVNHVAKWNGSSWSALGTGTDALVGKLLVVGSDLYAGGQFSTAGGVSAGRVAKWNGSVWSPLGTGVGGGAGYVYSLAAIGSDVYAGGAFLTAGGVPANHIAKWNGSAWSALGDGSENGIGGLAVIGTDLYAAGSFPTAIGGSGEGIARWNGTSWFGVTDYAGGPMVSDGTDLYAGAGAQLPTVNGEAPNRLAKWNGSSWSILGVGRGNGIGAYAMGGGVYPSVSDLAPSGSGLYVAGSITKAGGVAASHIAHWTGSTWLPLGAGLNGQSYAIAVLGGDVYVGGWFTTAGGSPSVNIAKWTGSPAVCGDGAVLAPNEECDDNNLTNGDGCSDECLLECEAGFTGVWVNASSHELTIIDEGTGTLRGHLVFEYSPEFDVVVGMTGEASGRDVGMSGTYPGNFFPPFRISGYRQSCDSMDEAREDQILPVAWTRISTVVCGDGSVDPGEDCDLGADNMDEICGDAVVEDCSYTCRDLGPGSSCEDGNSIDGDGCDNNCTPTGCGNGIVTEGEGCDDQNLVNDDGCNQNCQLTQCGDGLLTQGQAAFCDPGELCVDSCNDDWIFPFGAPPLIDGEANAVLVDGDDYYVGGYFFNGDFNSIARWNNGVWTPLAKGFGDETSVYVLAKFGSKIYAAGEIVEDRATGAPLPGIASWDGTAWSPVGGGVTRTTGTPSISAMLATDDHLYVGGHFDHAGAIPTIGLARWDGAAWTGIGDLLAPFGEPGGASAFLEIGDDLYVAGYFESAGGVAASNIAKWDGVSWSPLGAGLPDSAGYLATDGTNVYAGGNALISMWDGASWTTVWDGNAMAGGPPGSVRGLVAIGDYLYAGGSEFSIGIATGVARWDGSDWTALGSGVTAKNEFNQAEIRGMFADGDRLIVAGNFYRAGGKVSEDLAVWTESNCGEKCDDGNAVDGDGCDTNCSVTACGNGVPTAGEECDDGNPANGDGCDSNCTETECGNGIGSAGETCDDGNAVAGDGCESDCKLTTVTQIAPPGGTVSSPPATEQFPVQAAITSPSGGSVSIGEATTPGTTQGFAVVGTILEITAPPATVVNPLIIAMTVHLSAVPAGVDPENLGVTRDGVAIAACTGIAGQASPDPCIASRSVGAQHVTITVATSHASQWTAVVPAMDEVGQKCLLGATKAAAGVATTQLKGGVKCLKTAETGDADFDECVATVAGTKAGKAMQKTVKAAAPCDPGVAFGLDGTTTANIAAFTAGQLLLTDVLGTGVSSTIEAAPASAACRAAATGGIGKVFGSAMKLFLACEKAGLASETAPFVSSADIAGCLDAVQADAEGSMEKAVETLTKKAGAACTPSTLLPGKCSGASDVADCLHERVNCRLCRMLTTLAGFDRDCDDFDDSLLNGSCL
jgi:cysteine-rich repeat protein